LGYGSWPVCGELDICEFQGSKPDQWQSNIHTRDYNGTNGQNFHLVKPAVNVSDSFHVWSIEWLPTTSTTAGKIKFFYDGVQYWTFNSLSVIAADYPFTTPIYVILNLAIGGTMGGPVDDTIFPKQMLVDYVRYYQDVPLAVNDVKSKDNPIIPTFFNESIDIQFSDNMINAKTISIFDIYGKMIKNTSTNENQTKIDMNSVNKGIYLVKISSGTNTYSQKVVKN
jgi:beta-glucanase (GH16 family)